MCTRKVFCRVSMVVEEERSVASRAARRLCSYSLVSIYQGVYNEMAHIYVSFERRLVL